MIRHHPSAATLTAYAAGTLPEALSLVAATHIGQCVACQARVAAAEWQAGAALDGISPVALQEGALEQMLARLDGLAPPPPPVLNPDLPPPLNRVDFGRSWPTGLGLYWRPMRTAGAAWGGLILVRPGHSVPWHGHTGLELTCVLSGAFSDGTLAYRAGDLQEQVDDHAGALRVVGAEPCLCVIASEGLEWPGWLGRIRRALGRSG